MIPDIVVTWPLNCDYPLWRQFIRDNRSYFNEIIIGFHNTHTKDNYSQFVENAMRYDYIHTFNVREPMPGEDWRNLSVNAGLLHSYNADWIWFTEQDFYPKDTFWNEVTEHETNNCDVIAAYDRDRMHPCCIFVKRSILEKTQKQFGILVDKADHFYQFQKDIENMGCKIGKINPDTYYHYNGLSQNWYLASIGEKPNYHLPEFIDYLTQCLRVMVPLHEDFVRIATDTIAGYNAEMLMAGTSPASFEAN